MNHFGYLAKYYAHLYTVTGGTLEVSSGKVLLWGQNLYQVRLYATWNGKDYAGAYRHEVRSAVSWPLGWGDPNHPLVYQTAVMLRELCKTLSSHGCDYAIPSF